MRLVRDYPIRHARSSPTGHFFFAIFPRHSPTQPFPWVGPSNAPFGSEKRPFFRTHPSPVLRPSMPGAVFLEGPAFFPGTFHARGRFPGRSCLFHGDLPCQGSFSWKVLPFPRGPSMPGAVFLEGAVVRTVLVILLYDFLLRVQSNLAVFDLTLLRFFKSKISGPRRVWGIRSPGNLVRLGPQ